MFAYFSLLQQRVDLVRSYCVQLLQSSGGSVKVAFKDSSGKKMENIFSGESPVTVRNVSLLAIKGRLHEF